MKRILEFFGVKGPEYIAKERALNALEFSLTAGEAYRDQIKKLNNELAATRTTFFTACPHNKYFKGIPDEVMETMSSTPWYRKFF